MATTDDLIVAELRAQIDHQVSAADASDTKAAGLAAATFALFTFTLPHLDITTPCRAIVAALVIGATLLAIGCFALTLKPRKGAFAYGVNAVELLAARDAEPIAFLPAYEEGLRLSREKNETVLKEKADGITNGLLLLVVVGFGLALLLALGGISGGA